MSIQQKFQRFLAQHPSLHGLESKWLVAVSGGVDSVALCHLCSHYQVPYAMAHCNFGLRAKSDDDQAFVQQLAKQLEVEIFMIKFDTVAYMKETGTSVQVAARELRYQWFHQLLVEHGLDSIVTAHHANDNVETVLMNLFRGTGIKGLRGIQPVQGRIIRPLLAVTKENILAYAKENQLSWVEDASNATDKYTRNFIRNQILPMMEKAIPREEQGFEKTFEMMAEVEVLYNQALDVHKKKLIEIKGNEVHIPVLKLAKSQPLNTITYEIIKDFGFTAAQTQDVLHLLQSESGKFVASSTHRIIRNRAWLIIAPLQTAQATHILIENAAQNIVFQEGILELELVSNSIHLDRGEKTIGLLDAAAVRFPLLLRPTKTGDYFYPLGMKKTKKLARFFIDQKLSKTDKEKIWVVESNKCIIWVVGLRIDERFKIQDKTEQVIRLKISTLH